jgi:hypothetical protein
MAGCADCSIWNPSTNASFFMLVEMFRGKEEKEDTCRTATYRFYAVHTARVVAPMVWERQETMDGSKEDQKPACVLLQ